MNRDDLQLILEVLNTYFASLVVTMENTRSTIISLSATTTDNKAEKDSAITMTELLLKKQEERMEKIDDLRFRLIGMIRKSVEYDSELAVKDLLDRV